MDVWEDLSQEAVVKIHPGCLRRNHQAVASGENILGRGTSAENLSQESALLTR